VFTGSLLRTRTGSRLIYLWHELPEISLLLYAIVTGIGYSVERRARIARIEADAAKAQLAALRAQLHPHFLFNALHAVVQLIQVDPARATEAAELVASLLRVTLEENRDEVPLGDEWNFVSRYLEMEGIRFGDRLRIHADVSPDLFDEKVPSFALQTLVENAVRHGAEKSSAPTDIAIKTTITGSVLNLSVRNTGNNLPAGVKGDGVGTGLSRLRERLSFLYGEDARLTSASADDGSYEATLTVPRRKVS
jgi:LytS/YehU family sensor histidine kinase